MHEVLKQSAAKRVSHRARVLLEMAVALDRAGREREAIPRYREALSLGLPRKLRCDALLCLASSLETAGHPQSALRVLRHARVEFDEAVVDLFMASALKSCNRESQALTLLASRLLAEGPAGSRLRRFAPVLRRKLGIRNG